jgi:actin-related protein 2
MNPIVVDIGSSMKAGFAGDDEPRVIISSSTDWKSSIQEGIVTDWVTLELALKDILDKLHGGTFHLEMAEKNQILVAVSPFQNHDRIKALLFDSFHFRSVHVTSSAVLPLFAQGLTSGLVVECGEDVTFVAPTVEGILQTHLTRKFVVNGKDISEYLKKLLSFRTNSKSLYDTNTVDCIKSNFCYVAVDLEDEERLVKETNCLVENFSLPDGKIVKFAQERFECVEAFFEPSIIGEHVSGLSDFVFDLIQDADIDIRAELYKHIVVSGGSSLFPGFIKRLQKDINSRYLQDILKGDTNRTMKFKINIEAPPNRRWLVFEGASVLADLMKNKTEFWLQKQQD